MESCKENQDECDISKQENDHSNPAKIFAKFSLTYVVMQYYGYTDRVFYVLTTLSHGSRKMLRGNYEAFMHCCFAEKI